MNSLEVLAGGNMTGLVLLFDSYGNRWQYAEGDSSNLVTCVILGSDSESTADVVYDEDLEAFLVTTMMAAAGEYLLQVSPSAWAEFQHTEVLGIPVDRENG